MNKKDLHIFIVEDDANYGQNLSDIIDQSFPEYQIHWFKTGQDCLDNIHLHPSAITLDYNRADKMPSDEILNQIHDFNPEIPVIIVSGQIDVKVAVNLLKEGAYDYVVKDNESIPKIVHLIEKIIEKQKLITENSSLKKEVSKKYSFNDIIIGNSKVVHDVFDLMEKASGTNILVTINGETGTGKDLVAKAIHYNSSFSKGSFVVVNMAAIPNELIESELFGHEKGAFTGAITRRVGKFELAHKGTIFLDEIAETPLHLQTKLLRVLQDKEITRVGGNETVKVITRIVVATNKNLEEEVHKGNFREDLYYRLMGFPIKLPPLRERGDDCLILAKHFLDDFCAQNNMEPLTLDTDAQNAILQYEWPGNVRELKAIIERAAVMTNKGAITKESLNFSSPAKLISQFFDPNSTLEEYKFKILDYYLKKNNNNIDKVSRKLELSKATIYRMLKAKPMAN